MKSFANNLEKKFYRVWGDMKYRCFNPNCSAYKNYGERGITVCDKWILFEGFKEDMWDSFLSHIELFGVRQTTLDRINPNLNYSLDNCKWATYKEQRMHVRNKAKYEGIELNTGNKIIFDNLTKFCKDNNLTRSAVNACIAGERLTHKGWTFKRLTQKER